MNSSFPGLGLGIRTDSRVHILDQSDFRVGQRGQSTNERHVYDNLTAFQTADIRSKHGVILSCSLTIDDTSDSEWLDSLGRKLEGQRYGFLDKVTEFDGCGRTQEVQHWLVEEMAS